MPNGRAVSPLLIAPEFADNLSSHSDRRPSPTLNLGTNNPFRRGPSPDPTSPVKRDPLPSASQERPMSRNPFLDPPSGANTTSRAEQDAATAKLADDIFVSKQYQDVLRNTYARRAGIVGNSIFGVTP